MMRAVGSIGALWPGWPLVSMGLLVAGLIFGTGSAIIAIGPAIKSGSGQLPIGSWPLPWRPLRQRCSVGRTGLCVSPAGQIWVPQE